MHLLLARLPPPDRLVLTLIYLDGCTVAEAADRAGWTTLNNLQDWPRRKYRRNSMSPIVSSPL
ncbi:MAG: sigma factor-like helix-turn-helix DNA-binding protein [Planctomycetaceae bacterium]